MVEDLTLLTPPTPLTPQKQDLEEGKDSEQHEMTWKVGAMLEISEHGVARKVGDIGAGPGRRRTLGEPAEEDTSGGTTGEGWTGEGLGEKGRQVLYSPGLAHAHGHMDMAHGTRELCNKSQMSLLTPEQS